MHKGGKANSLFSQLFGLFVPDRGVSTPTSRLLTAVAGNSDACCIRDAYSRALLFAQLQSVQTQTDRPGMCLVERELG